MCVCTCELGEKFMWEVQMCIEICLKMYAIISKWGPLSTTTSLLILLVMIICQSCKYWSRCLCSFELICWNQNTDNTWMRPFKSPLFLYTDNSSTQLSCQRCYLNGHWLSKNFTITIYILRVHNNIKITPCNQVQCNQVKHEMWQVLQRWKISNWMIVNTYCVGHIVGFFHFFSISLYTQSIKKKHTHNVLK